VKSQTEEKRKKKVMEKQTERVVEMKVERSMGIVFNVNADTSTINSGWCGLTVRSKSKETSSHKRNSRKK